MTNWQIVLLHTQKSTLLKRAFEAAFPGQVTSIHVPALGQDGYREDLDPKELVTYFRRKVFDPGLWNGRVLTVYGDGEFHHYTYALTKLSAELRGLDDPEERNWTYFHFDNHRDDWGTRERDGYTPTLNCASFVDPLVYDQGAVPFMIGPDPYPKKDSRGYRIRGKEIPIYHNWFTKARQRSREWKHNAAPEERVGGELPAVPDLRETPTPSYFSFDLDLLSPTEIATNFDQNYWVTVRRLCTVLDRLRPFKRVFGADILGFPDRCQHALSALTMIILARKILGLSVERFLEEHTRAKRRQAGLMGLDAQGRLKHVPGKRAHAHTFTTWLDPNRPSPISEGELLEIVRT